MIKVRAFNWVKLNNKILAGFELDSTGESYYKNSKIIFQYMKDNKVVYDDQEFVIDYITCTGILYLAHEYTEPEGIEYDGIRAAFKKGELVHEITYLPNIKLEFGGYNQETRTITYKIKNTLNKTLESASLHLVFFNKGEIVAGKCITKENLLNERIYYYEYVVPENIDFTETCPYLTLPSTNHLLFNDFFAKYSSAQELISQYSSKADEPLKNHVEYDDKVARKNGQINAAIKEKTALENKKTKGWFGVLIKNIGLLLKNLIFSVPGFFAWMYIGMSFPFGVTQFIIEIVLLLACIIRDAMYVWYTIFALLAVYLIHYIYFCIKHTKYFKQSDFLSKKQKNKQLHAINSKIEHLKQQQHKAELMAEQDHKDVAYQNAKIDRENKEIEKRNHEKANKLSNSKRALNKLLQEYPEYAEIQNWSTDDFYDIARALNLGAYDFASVKEFVIERRKERLQVKQKTEQLARENALAKQNKQLQAYVDSMKKQIQVNDLNWQRKFNQAQTNYYNQLTNAINDFRQQAYFNDLRAHEDAKRLRDAIKNGF